MFVKRGSTVVGIVLCEGLWKYGKVFTWSVWGLCHQATQNTYILTYIEYVSNDQITSISVWRLCHQGVAAVTECSDWLVDLWGQGCMINKMWCTYVHTCGTLGGYVEMEHYSVHILTAWSCQKHCSAELVKSEDLHSIGSWTPDKSMHMTCEPCP